MTRPVLYMDFDGVVNFVGSRTRHTKVAGLGYLRRNGVWANKTPDETWKATHSYGERYFNLNWSAELVRKLDELNADWLWLTSWKEDAPEFLDPMLGVKSAGALDWDYSKATNFNHALKFVALLADQDANPRPFVWVDDEATVAFDADAFLTPVPHLVVCPDDEVGLTADDLAAITEFVTKHGGE